MQFEWLAVGQSTLSAGSTGYYAYNIEIACINL